MFITYLTRELGNRRRQTAIIAIGMALAIALVIIVNAVAAGVKDAQVSVLSSLYGVGTDITVTQDPAPPEEGAAAGGPMFEFEQGGQNADGSTSLDQSRLISARGAATFDETALDTVLAVDGVEAATGTLTLENATFSGDIPARDEAPVQTEGGDTVAPGGSVGGAFDVDSFGVTGIDPAATGVGPLSAVALIDGRLLTEGDSGERVVVLDKTYATAEGLGVGDALAIGGEDFEVVGIVASTSSDASTASDSYVSLDVAQELSGQEGVLSAISVQAASADAISAIKADLQAALPDASVSTQDDLAASVTGSLGTAAVLLGTLGTWLSVLVLAAAFLIAILFTISGVGRRTREFGTLKAIGWSNGRVVRQVAGESLVQGAIGGALGVAIGVIGVLVINLIAPTLTAGAAQEPGFGMPSGGPGGGQQGTSATDIVLQAPVTPAIVLLAVGLAILGGVLAGAIGGWRAARLRPAEALRSVA